MDSVLDRALREIVEKLLQIDVPSRADLDKIKIDVARYNGLPRIPRNSEILATLTEEEAELLLPVLRRKEARALSGVSVVAVMTAPYPCPHGRCAYCPGGPEEDSPQSYTGYEPAAMRGAQNEYDPYRQVKARIKQLETIGHIVDKVDLIIMGGTFPASPRPYQEGFVKGCLDALNDILSPNLVEAKFNAEKAGIRNVGITVETRPDYVKEKDIDGMLELGVTRVELGVQNVYDDVYQRVGRGHIVQDVVDATKRLKDSALKICYHMMPGLPGSSYARDLEGFKTVFEDPHFKPDMLKIYPTLVVKGTRLYDWWRRGEYTPLTTGDAAELVSKVMELTPPWVRIMRVQRDIPLPRIDAGVDMSNLRHALVGFVRLRIPHEPTRPEIDSHTGLIRELHVYGRMVPVGEHRGDAWQHKGWGEALMAEAEKTAKERYDIRKMIVMSALGTKQYYARLGYDKEGVYVSKSL
ncbi:MAG: tRNA uridine(34) 5-carboxymethylaminomethyl modification radical SAM/GNAT enzyme Elp3 [Candidatus Bathyarchaeota archaeon]|nr:tRNA uridine(34) 5-carboxymethylaminomethyl modification radical SAM/GNAT enzyme Elp3 [Candidatus Bathyarchaeota archaeon]